MRVVTVLLCVLPACSSSNAVLLVDDGPLEHVGTVTSVTGAQCVQPFDVDGDGDLDLVVSGEGLDVLRNDGAGEFTRIAGAPFSEPAACLAVTFGDFDGDGRLDIAAAEHDDGPYVFLYLATPAGSFRHAPHSPITVDAEPHLHTLEAFDADGDGHLDLLSDSWPQDRLVLVRGRGDGTFAAPGGQFAVPPSPINNLAVGDLDGDGHLDIATPAHDSDAVSILLGDGRGAFTLRDGAPFASFGGFSTVELVDLDGDGDLDIAEVHRGDPTTQYKQDALSVLLNDGTAAFTHAPGSPFTNLSGSAVDLAVGDLDGDGHADIVTISETTRVVSTFRGSPDGFTYAGSNSVTARPIDIAVADIDNDGRAEILIASHRTEDVTVLRLAREP